MYACINSRWPELTTVDAVAISGFLGLHLLTLTSWQYSCLHKQKALEVLLLPEHV